MLTWSSNPYTFFLHLTPMPWFLPLLRWTTDYKQDETIAKQEQPPYSEIDSEKMSNRQIQSGRKLLTSCLVYFSHCLRYLKARILYPPLPKKSMLLFRAAQCKATSSLFCWRLFKQHYLSVLSLLTTAKLHLLSSTHTTILMPPSFDLNTLAWICL